MEFSRQEYWNGLPFPPPEDVPNPGIKPGSLALPGVFLSSEPLGKTKVNSKRCSKNYIKNFFQQIVMKNTSHKIHHLIHFQLYSSVQLVVLTIFTLLCNISLEIFHLAKLLLGSWIFNMHKNEVGISPYTREKLTLVKGLQL